MFLHFKEVILFYIGSSVFYHCLYSNYINCNYYSKNDHRVNAHIYMDVNLDIWSFSTDMKCHLSWPNMFQLAHHTCPDCCRISLHLYKETSLSDCSDCSDHTHTDTHREREREIVSEYIVSILSMRINIIFLFFANLKALVGEARACSTRHGLYLLCCIEFNLLLVVYNDGYCTAFTVFL